jgi:hypothetical protein
MIKWVKRAAIVLLALAMVNDAGRYIMGVYKVDERARTMSFEAARIARTSRVANSAWPAVAKMAADSGVEVIAYQQSPTSATLTLRLQVTGTWLIGPTLALIDSKPLMTPFALEKTATSLG